LEPDQRKYAPAGRVLVQEGDAVFLRTEPPAPLTKPIFTSSGLGIYVGSNGRWYVIEPITKFERSGRLLRVYGEIVLEKPESRLIAFFWLSVGDLFGDEPTPRWLDKPLPKDPQMGVGRPPRQD
jgi:hypothetical protein